MWVDDGKVKRLIGVATGAGTQLNRVRRANPDMSADLRSWIMADGEPAWMREAEGPDSVPG